MLHAISRFTQGAAARMHGAGHSILCCLMHSIGKNCCPLNGVSRIGVWQGCSWLGTMQLLLVVKQIRPGLAAVVAIAPCCCGDSICICLFVVVAKSPVWASTLLQRPMKQRCRLQPHADIIQRSEAESCDLHTWGRHWHVSNLDTLNLAWKLMLFCRIRP